MEQAKHTPGPWRYHGGTSTCEKVLCANGKVVADTWWCRGSEESEANARLIAAAPDLLEALTKLASIDFGSQGWYEFAENAAREARAAIAKATGTTQ